MGVFVLVDAYLTVNSVDLSDHVRSLTLTYSAELLDASAMGGSTPVTRTRVVGLVDWTMSVEFLQDFAASNVDATLFPLVGDTTSFPIAVRPTSGAISTTNPEFQGDAFLESYPPISGGVAEVAVVTATFQGDGQLTRDVTP